MFKNLSRDSRFWIFLSVISLAGIALIGVATSKYGPGVSSDAVHNMATADSLLHGKGFFDHTGMPLVWWPPLYPLVLAGLGFFTRGDVFIAGWYLNAFLFGVNIFLNGILLHLAFKERPLFQYLGVLFVALSDSAIRVHANIASEPLYIAFSLVFLIAAIDYMQSRSRRAFWVMLVMAALASLQRWLGLSLVAAGGCLILYVNRPPSISPQLRPPPVFDHLPQMQSIWGRLSAGRRELVRGIGEAFLFGVLSILAVGAWVVGHNLLLYQTIWGNGTEGVYPIENLQMSLGKMMHWFVPYHPLIEPILFQPWIPLGIFLILLLLINRRADWQTWGKQLMEPAVFVPVAFFLLTLLGLMFNIVTTDHLDPTSDRYYVGLLSPALILLFVTLDVLIFPHVRVSPRLREIGFPILFLVWFAVYPGWSAVKYLSAALERGEPSNYNYYNNLAFHENPLIPEMQKIAQKDSSAVFYSNYSDAVWFFMRRPSPSMPRIWSMSSSEFAQQFAGWPPQDGYIVWFLPNEYKQIASPEAIAQIANVKLIFKAENGEIFRVTRK